MNKNWNYRKKIFQGDEGYAIICKDKENKYTIVGLSSIINEGCVDKFGVVLFTDVRLYYPWIKTTIKTIGTECGDGKATNERKLNSGSQFTHSFFLSICNFYFLSFLVNFSFW